MKKAIFLVLCLSCFISNSYSQSILDSLETYVPGEGIITIHQDTIISQLIGTEIHFAGDEVYVKAQGYRIQAFAGNNTRRSKNEAYKIGENIKEIFPELSVYTSFDPPRWVCLVGDFRSIEEADAMMRKLHSTGKFNEVSIVRDEINISL